MPGFDVTGTSIRYRVREPSQFQRMRTGTLQRRPLVRVVYGILSGTKSKVQALIFPKSAGWTLAKARAWVAARRGRFTEEAEVLSFARYETIEEASAAGLPTVIDDAPLSLEQINILAAFLEDEEVGSSDEGPDFGIPPESLERAMKLWRRLYRLENQRWLGPAATQERGDDIQPINDLVGMALEFDADAVGENDLPTATIRNVPLFEPGKHNGRKFSDRKVQQIVDDTNRLHGMLKPFVKVGHDSPLNALGDGMPSLGWLGRLKRIGRTVAADFHNVPIVLARLINARAFRRMSAELIPNFEHDGVKYPYVLRAAAILGAELPAVHGLKDIPKALYNAAYQPTEGQKAIAFSIKLIERKEPTMGEIEDAKDAAKKQAEAQFSEERKKLEDEKKKSHDEAEQYKKDLEAERALRLSNEAERFVSDHLPKIKPKWASVLTEVFKHLDSGEVFKFTEKSVDAKTNEERVVQHESPSLREAFVAFVKDLPEQIKTEEFARRGEGAKEDRGGEPGHVDRDAAKEIMERHNLPHVSQKKT
jgi:hypothetical protein